MKEQDEAIRMNFGKYETPNDLKRLMDLDDLHEMKGSMKDLDSTDHEIRKQAGGN